jgi:hypothetical protein
MPSSDLSFAADYYEMTGGMIFGKLEFFSGAGISATPRVHQRSAQAVSESDDLPFLRVHIGAAWELLELDGFAMRVFALLGTDLTTQLFEDTSDGDPSAIDSVITSTKELGLQFSTIANRDERDSTYFEPVVRIAYGIQSGKVQGGAFSNADGSQDFSAKALIVTFGLNLGLGGVF